MQADCRGCRQTARKRSQLVNLGRVLCLSAAWNRAIARIVAMSLRARSARVLAERETKSSMSAQLYKISACVALACALAGPASAAHRLQLAALDGNAASIGSSVTRAQRPVQDNVATRAPQRLSRLSGNDDAAWADAHSLHAVSGIARVFRCIFRLPNRRPARLSWPRRQPRRPGPRPYPWPEHSRAADSV